jgi:hypothetical protein
MERKFGVIPLFGASRSAGKRTTSMSNPFEEIREHVKKQKEEQARQEQLRQLEEQKHEVAVARFGEWISQCAPMINQVLDEFGATCWGWRTEYENTIWGRKTKQEKGYYLYPLKATDLHAWASVGKKPSYYFIKIEGDEDGNISRFSVGREIQHTTWDSDTYYSYEADTVLPDVPTKKDLEEALVKSWRKGH